MEAVRNTIGVPVTLKTPAKLNVKVLSTALKHMQKWAVGYVSTCFYARP
jgi:hypothetical protein